MKNNQFGHYKKQTTRTSSFFLLIVIIFLYLSLSSSLLVMVVFHFHPNSYHGAGSKNMGLDHENILQKIQNQYCSTSKGNYNSQIGTFNEFNLDLKLQSSMGNNGSGDDNDGNNNIGDNNTNDNNDDGGDNNGGSDGNDNDNENETKDKDNNGINDDIEMDNQRSLSINISSYEAQIDSIKTINDTETKICFKIKLDSEGLIIETSYSNSSEDTETQIDFEAKISKLIEYRDLDNNLIFDKQKDIEVSSLNLNNFDPIVWSNISLITGANLYIINVSTHDKVFRAVFYFSGQFINFTKLDGQNVPGFIPVNTILNPAELKFNLFIENYTFHLSSSRLALSTIIESENDYEFKKDDMTQDEKLMDMDLNEEEVSFNQENLGGFLSWANQSYIDGDLSPIYSSDLIKMENSEDAKTIFLNFKQGSKYAIDPKIGVLGVLIIPNQPPNPNITKVRNIILYIIIISLGILTAFGILMSKEEYRNYLLRRQIFINKGLHNLNMEDVLDNQIRSKIIDLIIDNPGIHYNELLRQVGTSASNLAWHLDILETYKVIQKKRIGRYLIFYPYIDKNPFAKFNANIAKSKTTLDIFQLIADNPGIYQGEIARRMSMDHKTIKYHLDKLFEANLIRSDNAKKKRKLYVNEKYLHYFENNNNQPVE